MKMNFKETALLLGLSMTVPATSIAQDKVEASVGADLVSGYIWRGQDLGGVSIQPSLSVAYKGFSLGAWGSAGIESADTKELDLTLGYSTGGFSISVTDYWFNGGPGYFHYGTHHTSHVFEAQIGYDFGPLAVNWYTNFAGADGVNKDGDRAYSRLLQLFRRPCMQRFQRFRRMRHQPWGIQGNQDYRLILSPRLRQGDGESAHRRGLFRIRTEFLTGSAENADTITNSDITTK